MRLRVAPVVVALAVALLGAALAGGGQPPPKVSRVGFLSSLSPSVAAPRFEAFRQRLREAGWVEGQNLTIESRWAEGKYERLPALADELVRLKVDVIVAIPTPASLAAKNATGTIPIVFAQVGDPVGVGFVASLARPGGNMTGVSILHPELSGKRLELLKGIIPGLSRVAVLLNPNNPGTALSLRETETAARLLQVELQVLEVRDPSELDRAFSAMTKERAGALVVLADFVFIRSQTRMAELAGKNRLPTMYPWREPVDAGGLMAYGANTVEQWRRAADYVDKILKGAKPADLPVEQPTRFELVINLKTAKALGLTIPQSIVIQANQLIQ